MRRLRLEAFALVLLTLAAAGWPAYAGMVASKSGLCAADEHTVMACKLSGKQAVVCASPVRGAPDTLTYRYGSPRRVELSIRARVGNGSPFGAAVHPAAPRAWVHQLWADRGRTRYVLTQCVGSDCAHRAGLLVLGPRGLISARACDPDGHPEPAFDAPWLHFGSDLADSHSDSQLIRFKDTDNQLEALYPPKAVN